jgi:hypothetical protein
MGGSPDINYPAQPTYGEGMADALKAQVELLTGQGDFAEIAPEGLAGLLPLEEDIRRTTAQTDTDILRQTLLGSERKVQVELDPESGKYGIPGAEVVTDEEGEPQVAGGGRYQMVSLGQGELVDIGGRLGSRYSVDLPTYGLIDTETGGITTIRVTADDMPDEYVRGGAIVGNTSESFANEILDAARDVVVELASQEFTTLNNTIEEAGGDTDAAAEAVAREFTFENPYTGEPLEEGQTVTIREGDGMVDLLGDQQDIVGTRSATAEDVEQGLATEVGEEIETRRKAGFDESGNFLGLSALAEDIQRGNLSRQREADLADVERLSDRYQDVMSDFKPGTAEGITGAGEVLESQRQRLTGQRPATAQDVASGLATEVGEMIQGDDTLITAPTGSTYGGDVTGVRMRDVQLSADGPQLTADTSYGALDPLTQATLSADTSFNAAGAANPIALTAATSYDPSADIAGGALGGALATGDGTLRSDIITQAQEALGQGLTDREERQIAEAARARSTMMGRTFDQSAAIQEAEARVLEDNQRRMQNRAFAQQVLGQEAGLQESDLSRDLQAQLANQRAINQARQMGMQAGLSQEALAAQQAQAKALADQSAINRAREFGVSAGMGQEEAQARMRQQAEMADLQAEQRRQDVGLQAGLQQDTQQAEIDQQRDILQAQLNQQAAAFGAESAQQAALANQRQAQQAEQFGVGAQMDAERLDAQLKQSGALGYVDAATRLAALEDQYTLDPFAAILNRAGGGSLQAGQSVLGQANYGLTSGPQYLNPESGLGYISQMAANEANMYGAQLAADASRSSGMMSGLGSLFGGAAGGLLRNPNLFCWVAREVYGPTNPAWMQFREWMFTESPSWFFNLYKKYGEQFAQWISDKPRIKSIIRKWMDSKIGDK